MFRPHVYQPPPGEDTAGTSGIDAALVAEWLVDHAPAYINLVNDSFETVTFTEKLDDGSSQGQQVSAPAERLHKTCRALLACLLIWRRLRSRAAWLKEVAAFWDQAQQVLRVACVSGMDHVPSL